MSKKIIFIGIATTLIVTSIIMLTNPLRKSQEDIRNMILSEIPLGTSINDVKSYNSKKNWELDYEWEGVPSKNSEDHYPAVKGSHIIGAYLGKYWGPLFRTDVDAFWGFNSSGKLIDFRIRKMTDAL